MVMIQAIVRPEKVYAVLKALLDAGFPGATKMDVFGRGKQRGLKVGDVTYDELPKEMLLVVVKNEDQPGVVNTIVRAARTGDKGAYGDGKIFVLPVEESYTISLGTKDGEAALNRFSPSFVRKRSMKPRRRSSRPVSRALQPRRFSDAGAPMSIIASCTGRKAAPRKQSRGLEMVRCSSPSAS